ncbi:hypothetical protein SAY86_001998 [Trapa natans]|uniref:Ferredoxin thioredoxin reductase alpha chain domain-containing protein n=1 Tax=Trapa natans TaxID=22666 RepID=A0AAN7LJI7_TRANT|nr:hypothetical protein SAY86_001998 [Trapa natans]
MIDMAVCAFKPTSAFTLPRSYTVGYVSSSVCLSIPSRMGKLSVLRRGRVFCEAAAVRQGLEAGAGAAGATPLTLVPAPAAPSQQEKEGENGAGVVGARVRVKVALKVYHVPRMREVELGGMEGTVKQYVAMFRGGSLSASLPFKVEFVKEVVEGGGSSRGVKFTVHLKREEFDYI